MEKRRKIRLNAKGQIIILVSLLLCLLTGCEQSLFYLSEPTPTIWLVKAESNSIQTPDIILNNTIEPSTFAGDVISTQIPPDFTIPSAVTLTPPQLLGPPESLVL